MITIKDIASEAGVSVSTVSRVINNRPDVSEVARNKVLEVAHKLNYIPNESARDFGRHTI
ncbi:MAG: LacI family DNA-binding transcriptional regulator [Bacillota bacterium]|nr:LacI family DNA-binding transcriptional regulator [Bacillota bacterium]